MESSALLQSFHYKMYAQGVTVGMKQFCSPIKRKPVIVSCIKSPEAAVINKSDDAKKEGSLEKKNNKRTSTFHSGLEALLLEVCDKTKVAELKMKVGDFEMHMKRDIEAANASDPKTFTETRLPVPAKSVDMSHPAAPPLLPAKSEQIVPFNNISKLEKSSSGTDGYLLVTSPYVGVFYREKKKKGVRKPPRFIEGVIIKERQVVGYVELFGRSKPVKSSVAGKVVELLVKDGEPVGYGAAIATILP